MRLGANDKQVDIVDRVEKANVILQLKDGVKERYRFMVRAGRKEIDGFLKA
jgi:hypothetical protein